MAFSIKEKATRPTYVVQLREFVGTPQEQPIDLRNALSVHLILRSADAAVQDPSKFRKPANIMYPTALPTNDAQAGWVEYVWVAGDTTPPGNYNAEFDIAWTATDIETVPNKGYFAVTIEVDLEST